MADNILHCECGATRTAPAGLRTLSCIKCGRAMHPPLPPAVAKPSTVVLSLATLMSQLVCAPVAILAIAWLVVERTMVTEVMVAGGAALLAVLAAWLANRGSVFLLLFAALIDAAVVGVSLARTGVLAALQQLPGVLEPDQLALGHAAAAGLAAVLCVLAVPQARRYATWQVAQLERALAAKRL